MMPQIDYTKLRVIGAGVFTVVVTDGTYAIKIGEISKYAVDKLKKLAKYDLGVPVYYHQRCIEMPGELYTYLSTAEIYQAGDIMDYQDYIWEDGGVIYTDILIVGLAELYKQHDDERLSYAKYSHEILTIIDQLNKKAWDIGVCWSDDHIYNVGIYNGNPVILDV